MDFHSLITSGSYTAIFFLMIANGTVNFPSSQVLYLVVGYFVGIGKLSFLPAVISGALGNTVGNAITFLLIRRYGHSLAHKLLMMEETTFKKLHAALHETFSKKGMWWLFVGKLTPSVKAFIPVVAGLGDTRTDQTLFIFLAASFAWACGVIYLGYTFGEHVSLSSFLTVSFLVGITVVYLIYRRISKKL
jgi:membrane protein DedA with SNARE-associated domain